MHPKPRDPHPRCCPHTVRSRLVEAGLGRGASTCGMYRVPQGPKGESKSPQGNPETLYY